MNQKPIETLIEELKEHLNEKEFESIEFEEGGREVNLIDIKDDLIELPKYYLKLFGEFYKQFKDYEDPRVKKFIEIHYAYAGEIRLLLQNIKSDLHYNTGMYKNRLITYVNKNYLDLVDFYDFALEVFAE